MPITKKMQPIILIDCLLLIQVNGFGMIEISIITQCLQCLQMEMPSFSINNLSKAKKPANFKFAGFQSQKYLHPNIFHFVLSVTLSLNGHS